jgi:proline dehydrogenase
MFRTLRKHIVKKISSRHIAGASLHNALTICHWAELQKIHSILSPWAYPGEPNRTVLESYIDVIKAIRERNINAYVSVKLESIDYDEGLFAELLEVARVNKVKVHLDSLGIDSASLNFKVLEKFTGLGFDLGCTLPSRWKRSVEDAERAIDLNLSVRVVKGQWPDPSAPKLDCRKNYIHIISKLSKGALHVGIATHDISLAEKAAGTLSSSNVHFELEQFFSLPLNGLNLSERLNCPYRIYIAYGSPGIPYNVRFAVSRPTLVGWIIKDFALRGKRPWEKVEA